MGRRGPIPNPKSGRSQAGRNTRKAAAKLPPADKVSPPAALAADPPAARFWRDHAPQLIAAGRLRQEQAETFGLLCRLFSDCEQLGEQVRREGWITATDKGQAASPVAKLLRDARRDFVALARDFGLTAASSARLPADEANHASEEDEEAALLRAFTGGA